MKQYKTITETVSSSYSYSCKYRHVDDAVTGMAEEQAEQGFEVVSFTVIREKGFQTESGNRPKQYEVVMLLAKVESVPPICGNGGYTPY